MERDREDFLGALLDEDPLPPAEQHLLAESLTEPGAAANVSAEVAFEVLLSGTVADAHPRIVRSRERLLAKVALRRAARRRGPIPGRFILPLRWAAAAALLLLLSLGVLTLRRAAKYPEPTLAGDFRIIPAAGGRGRASGPGRGDRILTGEAGATLQLGGYCDLTLDAGSEVVLSGLPREEVVSIEAGRVVSRITPGEGQYRVVTPRGILEVRGTEFATTVTYADEGDETMRAKSAIVTVLVMAGVVGFDFGGEQGLLGAGGSRTFAAEVAEGGLPDGIRGFAGIVTGTIKGKSEQGMALAVDGIAKAWPGSKAENPEALVGVTAELRILERQRDMRERLARFEVGARVAVGCMQREGNVLHVVELLVPAAELPALVAKWDAAAKEQETREQVQREEPRREEGGDGPEAEIRRLREENARLKRQLEELRR